jgi:TRAP-type C4-dicarboxylate transport system permease small subunit
MSKILKYLESVATWASIIAILAMMCLVTADALTRYIIHRPIVGAYEITAEYLVVAATFLGAAYTYEEGGFIRVTLLVNRLKGPIRFAVDYFVQILVTLSSLGLVVTSSYQTYLTFESGTVSTGLLRYPMGPAYALIPIGLLVMITLMLRDIPRVRSREGALFKGDIEGL